MSSAVFAQASTAPKNPAFDLADIHASPKSLSTAKKLPTFRAGRYEAQRVTMLDLIALAYSVDAAKVVRGPTWLDLDKFDLVAKAPPDTKPEVLKLMLQALLTD